MKATRTLIATTVALLFCAATSSERLAAAPGDARVTPGEFVVEHPTLINLGFEWHIDGDANRNAAVDVSYRKVGETAWRKGLPLARLQNERIYQRNIFNLVSPNMFAGSILDLEPDTAYEARFVMSDPDGIGGPAAGATKTVTVRTRPEPMPAAGGKVYHVYPVKWKGEKIEPAFEGIMCAYNYYCGAGDTSPGGRPRVKPGDIVLVHAGTYAYHYEFYANQTSINATTTFEGTYYLSGKGTPERPIVIKAAGDGEVDPRRPRQFQPVQHQGGRLQLLRGAHLPEHQHRDLGGHAVHRRIERADGEALPVRRRRHGRVHELLGLEQLLHRRQRVPRPERSEAPHRVDRPVLAAVRECRRASVPAGDEVVHRHPALRLGARRRLQLRRRLPRRHRHRDVRQPRRIARRRGPDLSSARDVGSPSDRRSTSTTTT